MSNARIVTLVLAMIAAVALGVNYGSQAYLAGTMGAKDVWASNSPLPDADPAPAPDALGYDASGDWERPVMAAAASAEDDAGRAESQVPGDMPMAEDPAPDEAE